jgi:two-component system response regulator
MRKLLIIEDNDADQELLLARLRKADIGNHVQFITDGRQAVDFLLQDSQSVQPEIFAVFLDLKLKGMEGVEVLRIIRSTPNLAKLPVIVITGSRHPEDRKACESLRVSSYITKPINFQEFCMALANVFHQPVLASVS